MSTDPDKKAVVIALESFSKRTQEIVVRLNGRSKIGAFEIGELNELYRSLKKDVKDATKRGRVSIGRAKEPTDWERYYYAPAMMKAANSLRAKTNTNPITSNWLGSLLDAELEFSYYLHLLQKTRH